MGVRRLLSACVKCAHPFIHELNKETINVLCYVKGLGEKRKTSSLLLVIFYVYMEIVRVQLNWGHQETKDKTHKLLRIPGVMSTLKSFLRV